jgi:hypothetical protein
MTRDDPVARRQDCEDGLRPPVPAQPAGGVDADALVERALQRVEQGLPVDATSRSLLRSRADTCAMTRARWAAARELRAMAWADDLLRIADEGDDVQRDALRTKVRQWLLSRLHASEYGDRTTIAGDAAAPLVVDEGTRVERIEALLRAAAARQGRVRVVDDQEAGDG